MEPVYRSTVQGPTEATVGVLPSSATGVSEK
jgi:hypothetical protein